MVPHLRVINYIVLQLVQINNIFLIVRFYVFFRVVTEDTEQLVGGLIHQSKSFFHTFFCSLPSFNPVAKEAEKT